MSRRLLAGLGVVILSSSSLSAQTLSIDHQPVGCAVAERFPRLEARFAPADTVATARVVFQPENAQQWYAVAMKSEGPAFSGVLPKPKKSLKAFRYYIEVTDKALGTNRTADYTTNVVASPGDGQRVCTDRYCDGVCAREIIRGRDRFSQITIADFTYTIIHVIIARYSECRTGLQIRYILIRASITSAILWTSDAALVSSRAGGIITRVIG